MPVNDEVFEITDGRTPLSGRVLGRLFKNLNARVNALELSALTVQQNADRVSQDLILNVHQRVDPVITTIRESLLGGRFLTGLSTTLLTIGSAELSVTLDTDSRAYFAPAARILVSDRTSPDRWFLATPKPGSAYNPETGMLVLQVLESNGAGAGSNWLLTASGPRGVQGATGAPGVDGQVTNAALATALAPKANTADLNAAKEELTALTYAIS